MDSQNIQENYMFSEPKYGWSSFNIFKYCKRERFYFLHQQEKSHIENCFSVSYIEAIPSMIFNALIKILTEKGSVIINFDAEGYDWSILFNYYDRSIQVMIPEEIINPFKDDNYFVIRLDDNITFKAFARDWCECYNNYRKEWNQFEDLDFEYHYFNEKSHTLLDEKYDELMELLSY